MIKISNLIPVKSMYSEVLGVLLALDNSYMFKLPNNIVKHIINNADLEQIPKIDRNKRIEDQKISKDARAFLTMLKIKYWCKSKEEKNDLLNLLNENEKKYQEKLKEEFDSDVLFKNKYTEKQHTEISIIQNKDNLFIKIINKIKKIVYKIK